MPFEQILGEAVFAGNCLISVNGSTPYMNLYGRTPTMLPDVTVIDDSSDPGSIPHTQRLREISEQQTLEGTAAAKVQRALDSKTRVSAQQHDYKIGDLVDYNRRQSNKDTTSWRGPAKVVDASKTEQGIITIRHQREMPIECRIQDVR